MKTLTEHRLINYFLLSTTQDESISSEEMALAYNEYKQHIFELSQQQISFLQKMRYLVYAKVELVSLKKQLTGATIPTMSISRIYLEKCLLLIDAEIKLVNFSVTHPEINEASVSFLSPLHWKGTLVNLMELISSLDYSELVTDENGKRLPFAGIVSAFEKLFNVAIPKPYDLRADLARRKKKVSVLLPKLKEAYEMNIINCGNGT